MFRSQGRFAWHELSTSNPAAARTFYEQVVPWRTQPSEHSENYTLLMNGNTPVGGVIAADAEPEPRGGGSRWLPFTCVYDIDACARQVGTLGGAVRFGPHEVPYVGTWAVIADPQGALLGLYEPEHDLPDTGDPCPGEFSWHELATADYKSAFDFYHPLLQWEKTSEFDMGAQGVYFMFGQRGRTYGGMFNRQAEGAAAEPAWLSYVRVDDVTRAAEAVRAQGGQVISGPMQVPSGAWVAQCVDPQGTRFALHVPRS